MPVEFAEGAGFEVDYGCGDGLGDGEIGRVDYGDGASAAGNFARLLLREVVDVGGVAFDFAVGRGGLLAVDDAAFEDFGGVRKVLLGGRGS